ncbi:MAG TPA: ABC transporter ATP-binding protein [Aggregatilineales bacterium]|nr:ABC transporter ATP-binding protein [Aggregatilineales bacterium]HPV07686.1 ABC transporter ATP-binding protein [Aggregatilineales bacterium]HQA69232.1 ABC transporter ATP-binding protein [Aggregatilineales bacterium]HQE17631.1 ABC transporter ATP-binding protein [Aggregatilineales bacterium]
MATIELRQVEKRFGNHQAVKPLDLTINDGEFVVLLGPSGCGKTTTLRMISGLETVTGGSIYLGGRNVTWLHPSERDIAFVFQLFALYPHLTVRQNITFPLQAQGESQETIERRLAEVVRLLRIEHILDSRPGKLSGGDRQRVALARALVRRPAAFLMDEPLGALDAEFRESMRAEIKQLHIDQNATTVYVTHDQVEAMAMGDRIVVMSNAEIQQVGTPAEVYHDPANLFVAQFIGSPGMNLVKGHYIGGQVIMPGDNNRYNVPTDWVPALNRATGGDGDVIVGFRPEAAVAASDGELLGQVYATDMHGAYTVLHVNMNHDDIVHVRSNRRTTYPIGTPVRFNLNPQMVRFFDPVTGQAIRREVVQ